MSTSLEEVHEEIGVIQAGEMVLSMASSPIAEPFALPDGDDDIIADLAAVGVMLSSAYPNDEQIAAVEQSRREAMAAIYLAAAGRCDETMLRHANTRDHLIAPLLARIERIRRFYDAQIVYEQRRRDELVRFVEHLAQLSTYPGKKKSIATPFGTFGYRDVSATVELVSEDAAIDWAKQMAPGYVQVTAKLNLSVAREYLTEPELAECKQTLKWGEMKKHLANDVDLPPGVQRVEGGRQFYAKVEVR